MAKASVGTSRGLDRYWAPEGATVSLDADGFLEDPELRWSLSGPAALSTTGELGNRRALILLGAPGSGKSTALNELIDGLPLLAPRGVESSIIDFGLFGSEDRLISRFFEAPLVTQWLTGHEKLCLLIDGFDEAAKRIPTLPRLFRRYLCTWPTDRLCLRIACRVAEWPHSLSETIREVFEEPNGIYTLQPLRRADVARFVSTTTDADLVLEAAARSGVLPLCTLPLTLKMLIQTYEHVGSLPGDAAELYERGLRALAEEQNLERRESGGALGSSPGQRVAAAGRLAACCFFSDRPAIWLGTSLECPGDVLDPSECVDSFEVSPRDHQRVSVSSQLIQEVLETALFIGAGTSRLTWAHSTFSEYLTAKWISGGQLSNDQVKSLLFSEDGRLFPQSKQVAAWCVALHSRQFAWIVKADPIAFLGTLPPLPKESCQEILHSLFSAAEAEELEIPYGVSVSNLNHEGVESLLLKQLYSNSPTARRLAELLVVQCRVIDGCRALVSIALDPDLPLDRRVAAAAVLPRVRGWDGVRELLPLLSSSGEEAAQAEELKGAVLLSVWPEYVSTGEVLDVVEPPAEKMSGLYRYFLQRLAGEVSDEHLQGCLRYLQRVTRTSQLSNAVELTNRCVEIAFHHVLANSSLNALANYVEVRAENFEPLFVRGLMAWEPPELAPEARRRLVGYLIQSGRLQRNFFALVEAGELHGLGLVRAEDFAWLISEYETTSDETSKERLADLIRWVFRFHNDDHGTIVADLTIDSEILTKVLSPFFLPIIIDSDQAREMKKYWELQQVEGMSGEALDGKVELDRRLEASIYQAAAGDLNSFWIAARDLHRSPGLYGRLAFLNPDLSRLESWALLSREQQEALVRGAQTYVRVGRAVPAERGGGTIHFPSVAGVQGLVLIRNFRPSDFAELDSDVWARWIGELVPWPVGDLGFQRDQKDDLLRAAAKVAEQEVIDILVTLIEDDLASAQGTGWRWEVECNALWNDWLASRLLAAVRRYPGNESVVNGVLSLVLRHDSASSWKFAAQCLDPAVVDSEPGLSRQVLRVLLAMGSKAAWELISSVREVRGNLLVDALMENVTYGMVILPDDERRICDQAVWMLEQFPTSEDPPYGWGVVPPRRAIANLRDSFVERLVGFGTIASIDSLRYIASRFPEVPGLRMALTRAEHARRLAMWTPLPVGQLLRLASDVRYRIVNTERELLDVVTDALMSLQLALQKDTPEAQFLWDTRVRQPKSEEEMSDFIKNRLGEILQGRGLVINREVQIRRNRPIGLSERTDLRVDAFVETPSTVGLETITLIAEVKGAWNDDIESAMESQLLGRYMRDTGSKCGIYIVGWFNTDWWEGPDPRRSAVARKSRADMTRVLVEKASSLAESGSVIRVVVLDVSYRRPAPDVQ